jgi:hypothetical protein
MESMNGDDRVGSGKGSGSPLSDESMGKYPRAVPRLVVFRTARCGAGSSAQHHSVLMLLFSRDCVYHTVNKLPVPLGCLVVGLLG